MFYRQVSKGIRDDERCGRAKLLVCDEGEEPERMLEVSRAITWLKNTHKYYKYTMNYSTCTTFCTCCIVDCCFHTANRHKGSSPWRFNTLLLSDEAFNVFTESSVNEFKTINKRLCVLTHSLTNSSYDPHMTAGQLFLYFVLLHRQWCHVSLLWQMCLLLDALDKSFF